MKRSICIILCTALVFLSGCGLYNEYADVEKLLVTEIMGIDYIPGGVRVSCASSMGGKSTGLTGVGVSVEAALESIQSRSMGHRLFVRHTGHIIVGEQAARHGMEDILEYICRSPEMRIDTPLYILRGGEASKLIESAEDISHVLAGISDYAGGALRFTASDILSDMFDRSAALVCTLESSRASTGGEALTASLSGCAVIKNYRLCAFLDKNEALGAAFLTGKPEGGTLTLTDSRIGTVTLAITDGSSELSPIRNENGELTGLSVNTELTATVSEIDGGVAAGSEVYMLRLKELTEQAVSAQINAVLRLAASLGTDFLGLGRRTGVGEELASLLPVLEMQSSVRAVVSHTNDMKDSV